MQEVKKTCTFSPMVLTNTPQIIKSLALTEKDLSEWIESKASQWMDSHKDYFQGLERDRVDSER